MTAVRRDALKQGDHIYTNGSLYDHHGIFVGKATVKNPKNVGEERKINDAVIHFLGLNKKSSSRPPCETCFYLPQNLGVVITCLDCFLEGGLLYVYQYNVSSFTFHWQKSGTCCTYPSNPPDQVIQRAFDVLEKRTDFGEYHLLFNNCEDFATFCKTGKAVSNQAAGYLSYPGAVVYHVVKDWFYRN